MTPIRTCVLFLFGSEIASALLKLVSFSHFLAAPCKWYITKLAYQFSWKMLVKLCYENVIMSWMFDYVIKHAVCYA